MVSAFLKVCVAAAAMQALLHLRPDYPAIEHEVKRVMGLPDGLLAFQLSIAEIYPLLLGILALSVSGGGPLTPLGLGVGGSILVVVGEEMFVMGVAWRSVSLLFVGRLVFSLGEVFAQDVALIPLWMEHFTTADTSILYAAVIAASYFARACGLKLYRWLQEDYGFNFCETLSFFWSTLVLYPLLYITMEMLLPADRKEHTHSRRESSASVLHTVLQALRGTRELPCYFWLMMTAAGLFNASSFLCDDFTLLPEVFDDVDTDSKARSVMAGGYSLLGAACLLVTCLYYRGVVTDENPRLTAKLLFLLLGLRLAGFVYIGARLLLLGRQVSRYWGEVGVEVLVHLGTFLFDMWAEPHLVHLAGHGATSEACVMGLLTSLTAATALPLVHLQERLFLWHADFKIAVQVAALSFVFLLMFLVWRSTPRDATLTPHSTQSAMPCPASPCLATPCLAMPAKPQKSRTKITTATSKPGDTNL